MNIPIILLNRDRLSCTERLCAQLMALGYSNIHIVDIDSTYPELLSWYDLVESSGQGDITIHRFGNIGHKGIWTNGFLKQFSEYSWVAVSDSDIALSLETPKGFLEQMIATAKDFRTDKCGLAITYHDITNSVLKPIIDRSEYAYWLHRKQHPRRIVYEAAVDTTMCVVRTDKPFTYTAIRIADWPIKHLDWYSNWNKLSAEEQYYMDNADEKIATTKQHYKKWLNSNH